MLKNLMILILCFGSFLSTNASEDENLFRIDGTDVKVSEFEYIYNKNNFDNKADYSEKSLREYLDLYINFRLKVKEAEALELDKDPKLQSELKVYQEQLYNSFYDKDLLKGLVKEAQERTKEDVKVSHIYIKTSATDTPEDQENAKQKIYSAYEALEKGNTFESVVKKFSDDEYSKERGGLMGFFTALQITFYEFENMAYNTPVGKYSQPIQTPIGYHIIKVNDKRPARGQVKVAIIKLNKSKDKTKNATVKEKIQKIHQQLLNGDDFSTIAKTSSDDPNTKASGGELDWVSIAQYDPAFEEQAFSLKENGDFTKPFETNAAWYIIKQLDRKTANDQANDTEVITDKIKKSDRYALARKAHIHNIQKKHGLTVNQAALKNFRVKAIKHLKSKENKLEITNPVTVLQIANETYSDENLSNFIKSHHKKYRKYPAEVKFDRLFEDFKEDKTITFHIIEYGNENKEYGALLNEYRDGILLFDLMEKKVWSKAVEDTIGLKQYYNNNKSKFVSKEKAEVKVFKVTDSKKAKLLAKVLKVDPYLQNVKFLKKLEKKGISSSSEKLSVEITDALAKNLNWKTNGVNTISGDNGFLIYQTAKVIPPKERSFEDSKGFAIAGYQEYLEKKWLKELHQKYNVVIDEAVLKGLIK